MNIQNGRNPQRHHVGFSFIGIAYFPIRLLFVVWMVLHGYVVSLLMFMTLPLALSWPWLYWQVIHTLYNIYYLVLCSLYYYGVGVRMYVRGANQLKAHSNWPVVIANHRSQADWLLIYTLILTTGGKNSLVTMNAVSRSLITRLSSLGLVSQFARTITVQRSRDTDCDEIREIVRLYKKHNIPAWILVCPEGVILHSTSLDKSRRWEMSHDLPCLTHCLHPRSLALQVLLSEMQRHGMLDSIYDFTFISQEYMHSLQRNNLVSNIIKGIPPRNIIGDWTQISRNSIQKCLTDESKLTEFLEEVWQRKDDMLHEWSHDAKSRPSEFPNQNSALMISSVIISGFALIFIIIMSSWTVIVVSILVMTVIGQLDGVLLLYNLLRVISDDLFEPRQTANFKFPLTIFR